MQLTPLGLRKIKAVLNAKLVLLRLQGENSDDVQAGAAALAEALRLADAVEVLGPGPCPLARLYSAKAV